MSAPVSEPSTTKYKSIILFWDRQLTIIISIQLANIAWFELSGEIIKSICTLFELSIYIQLANIAWFELFGQFGPVASHSPYIYYESNMVETLRFLWLNDAAEIWWKQDQRRVGEKIMRE
jgi:hypothetical protein